MKGINWFYVGVAASPLPPPPLLASTFFGIVSGVLPLGSIPSFLH